MTDGHSPMVLPESDWTARAENHERRVDVFTGPHRERANRGEHHPVWDFLFTYYSLRPRQLRIWHPGFGIALVGTRAKPYLGRAGYIDGTAGVTVGVDHLDARISTVRFIADLLQATAERPAQFGCFGMHEWAMVYRTEKPRHGAVPLRLGPSRTDAVVESIPLRCSHFDAYRFFTPAAVPRNRTALTRETQLASEQPGCIHAGMDLYKWAYKLGPLVDSELVMDCLDLAAQARVVDMRASPYDLSSYGYAPIKVEEPSGRAEYVQEQQRVSEHAKPLRIALLDRCRRLLGVSEGVLPAGTMNRFS